MDRYEELMGRRELMMAAWMREVDAAQHAGITAQDHWTSGTVLRKDGTLWMTGRNRRNEIVVELVSRTGETEVAVTRY